MPIYGQKVIYHDLNMLACMQVTLKKLTSDLIIKVL